MGDLQQVLSRLPQGFSANQGGGATNFMYRPPTASPTQAPAPMTPAPTTTPTIAPYVAPGWTPPPGTTVSRGNRQMAPEESLRVRQLSHRLATGGQLTDADREYLQQWLHEPRDEADKNGTEEVNWSTSREMRQKSRVNGGRYQGRY